MNDLYEFTVEWPSTSAQSVIVTGDFDQWSKSLPLSRSPSSNVFTATIKVPYGCPTRYKFIVDGEWLVRQDSPTEYSPEGYLNNVYYVPLKEPLEATHTEANEKENAPQNAQNGTAGQFSSDLADTIAAHGDTSGLDKTIHNADPIKSDQTSTDLPSSAPDAAAAVTSSIPATAAANGDATAANPESEATAPATTAMTDTQTNESTVAPIIPITIVPVYAKENCTIDPSKVVSEEEAVGAFVGVGKALEGAKEETKEEAKPEADEEPAIAPEVPVIVTSAPTPPKESAIVQAPKEEPVAPANETKKADVIPAEETKKTEEPTPTSEPAAVPETPAPSQPIENAHTRSDSGASTTLKSSSRPTTPTRVSSTSSAPTPTPNSTIRKSKIFPSLGHGSPKNKSKDDAGADELGVKEGNGTTKSGKKKRTSSFFGRLSLKNLFHHDKDKEKNEAH